MSELSGQSFIGFNRASGRRSFAVADRQTGEVLEPRFECAALGGVTAATELAWQAFLDYRDVPAADRATFLRAIAANLEANADAIVARAMRESALPEARLRGEMGRTCGQLRMFAQLLEDGWWVDARIDHAHPNRQPPKPDVRSMLRPLGPVLVLGASNFPLAFSVAGGDTASALAAGCPVVVKAHPAHPGTSEYAADAIVRAAQETGMPEGVFSMLFDDGHEVARDLAADPKVQAIGFTGSRKGGLALMELAASRPVPIPVYAEMSSVNPVFLLPEKLAADPAGLAQGVFGSVTLGVGQFCTNPGIIVPVGLEGRKAFTDELARLMSEANPGCMLTDGIHGAYHSGVAELSAKPGVETLVKPVDTLRASPALFQTHAGTFAADRALTQEVFGPSTMLVLCDSPDDAEKVVASLEGGLTASAHGTEADLRHHKALLSLLELKAGRLVINQYPTGVEVGHAIVHGGPFPSTSDGRSTSVGTRAITRFTRPVCYQNFSDDLLPAELKESNPLGIQRLVDGKFA